MAANQKYCPKCGTPSALDAVYCLSCGNRFPEGSSPSVPMGMATPPPLNVPKPVSVPPLPQTKHADFITLSCPNCGGKLQITADVERFACQFCGYEHIVRRSGGTVSLEPVVKVMQNIDANISRIGFSSEKQVAEQTITRLKKEIDEMTTRVGSAYDANQTAMILGMVMLMIGIGLIVGAIIGEWKFWVWIIALILGGFGVALVAATAKEPETLKAQNELLRRKREELERNYEIVRRS